VPVEARAMASRAGTAPAYRLRPAPRGGSRAQGASRIRWDKLGRVILVLALFFILVSYIHPLLGFFGAWNDKRAAATELDQLKTEHASLEQKAGSLNGRDAAERAARHLGMVQAGERAYVIKGLPGN
jgi:cell division protein FtsB